MSSELGKTTLDAKNSAEKIFGGLSQSKIDEIAKNTYKGFKAVISNGELEFWYKSASGKSMNMATFALDEAGKLVGYFGNGPYMQAKAPRLFAKALMAAMKNNN